VQGLSLRLRHAVANDRYLRIPAEDPSCREGSLGIATVDGTVFGEASNTLNVIGRETDEDSCAVPEAGYLLPAFPFPSFKGAPHNAQLFRETLGDLGPIGDHPGIASLVSVGMNAGTIDNRETSIFFIKG
jgi:hypothetical protein